MKNSLFKVSVFVAGLAIFALVPTAYVKAVGYGGGGGGGGGGMPTRCSADINPPPGGFRVSINQGASIVTSSVVQLTIDGGDAKRMMISNDPSFSGMGSESYVPNKSWTLPDGDGDKVVYVKLYDECGNVRGMFSSSVKFYRNGAPNNPPTGGQTGGSSGGQVLGEKVTAIDELIAELKYGSRSEDVVTLQNELKKLGFFPSSVASTGFYGSITLKAVNAYKASIGGMSTGTGSTGTGSTGTGSTGTGSEGSPVSEDADLDTLIASLRYNSRGGAVVALQTKLRILGFFPHWVRSTGWFGPITQGAVNAYVASGKSSVSASSSEKDLATLVSELKYGSSGSDVGSLQLQLQKLGFFPANLSVTGFYGPITKKAVDAYLASLKK